MPQQSLTQQQVQKQVQTLSPQQILVIKLLELPALEFEDRVSQEVLENPALEEGPDPEKQEEVSPEEAGMEQDHEEEYDALNDYRSEDEIPDYKLQDHNKTSHEMAAEIPFSDTASFYESLVEQLGEHDLSSEDQELAKYIIGSIDDDGLLRKPMTALSEELAIYNGINVSPEKLEKIRSIILEFDPPGIAAKDLQECLLVQIRRRRERARGEAAILLDIEKDIIRNHYDEFKRKHWEKIQQRMGLDGPSFQAAIHDIIHLNPRPGASMGESIGKNMQQIIPDFTVEVDEQGSINVLLNDYEIPQLRVNPEYVRIINERLGNGKPSQQDREALQFVKQKIESAQGFIAAIQQRRNTLLACMNTIVRLQEPFFLEGDESLLRPMILKDVAEITHLDISTVSRVSNSKYVQTDFGIFSLKFFFSDGYMTQDGEELSVRKIKNILKEIILQEDKQDPLTDDALTVLLAKKGYPIARRTVAKYRQQMNIPVARLRK